MEEPHLDRFGLALKLIPVGKPPDPLKHLGRLLSTPLLCLLLIFCLVYILTFPVIQQLVHLIPSPLVPPQCTKCLSGTLLTCRIRRHIHADLASYVALDFISRNPRSLERPRLMA